MRALAVLPHPELLTARQRIAELEAQLARFHTPEPEFWARFQGRHIRIRAADLDWVEAERDYVRLHTAEASLLHAESLGSLEARLDPRLFRRVHRSAIVRWDRTREVRRSAEGALVVVTGSGALVRVGRTFAPQLVASLTAS
jgi:two-component system LytT family response regulator